MATWTSRSGRPIVPARPVASGWGSDIGPLSRMPGAPADGEASMARILITGAGMVGCHTARALLDAGHDATFFDAAPRVDYIRRITDRDAAVIPGDLRDLTTVIDAVGHVRPDAVVHTAALIGDAAQQVPHRGFEV